MPNAPKPLHIGPAATAEGRRQNSHRRGYTRQWHNYTIRYLAIHVHCVHCEKEGRDTKATEVDHIIPFRGDTTSPLYWGEWNHQALCHECHSKKTKAGL